MTMPAGVIYYSLVFSGNIEVTNIPSQMLIITDQILEKAKLPVHSVLLPTP